jgi:hypothetical protein
MGAFRQDLAHAVRRLKQRPGFTLVATLTLAVGIGGATALFSVAHAVILRPLPYAAPDRLALVWQSEPRARPAVRRDVLPGFPRLACRQPHFRGHGGFPEHEPVLDAQREGRAGRARGPSRVVELLPRARVSPRSAAILAEDDDRRGAARVVVLSDALWRDRFESDPGIVGRALVLDGGRSRSSA